MHAIIQLNIYITIIVKKTLQKEIEKFILVNFFLVIILGPCSQSRKEKKSHDQSSKHGFPNSSYCHDRIQSYYSSFRN